MPSRLNIRAGRPRPGKRRAVTREAAERNIKRNAFQNQLRKAFLFLHGEINGSGFEGAESDEDQAINAARAKTAAVIGRIKTPFPQRLRAGSGIYDCCVFRELTNRRISSLDAIDFVCAIIDC